MIYTIYSPTHGHFMNLVHDEIYWTDNINRLTYAHRGWFSDSNLDQVTTYLRNRMAEFPDEFGDAVISIRHMSSDPFQLFDPFSSDERVDIIRRVKILEFSGMKELMKIMNIIDLRINDISFDFQIAPGDMLVKPTIESIRNIAIQCLGSTSEGWFDRIVEYQANMIQESSAFDYISEIQYNVGLVRGEQNIMMFRLASESDFQTMTVK